MGFLLEAHVQIAGRYKPGYQRQYQASQDT